MSRRVSRLRTEPPDRQPVLIVGALVVGLVVGLVMIPRIFSGIDSRVENYVLLASSLYAQGESPVLLRDRLVSVGVQQPASTVLSMAQRYASSRDKKQQHQAEALDAFGKVLLNPDTIASPTPRPAGSVDAVGTPGTPPPYVGISGTRTVSQAVPSGTPSPFAAVSNPTGASTSNPLATSTPPIGALASPVAVGTGTPVAAGTPAAGQLATPTIVTVSSTPGVIQRGRVKPADGGSARLRKEPSQDGGTLSLIPNAAQVEILETVRGQAIEGESRWLRVRYGNLVGYLWSKLVVVGD